MKHYYVYIDEGGMMGKCNVLLSSYPLSKKKEEGYDEIADYYFGYMPIKSVVRHVQLFKESFNAGVNVNVLDFNEEMAKEIHNQVAEEPGIG